MALSLTCDLSKYACHHTIINCIFSDKIGGPVEPARRDLGQVLYTYLQLPVRFGVKLRCNIRAVVGSASE